MNGLMKNSTPAGMLAEITPIIAFVAPSCSNCSGTSRGTTVSMMLTHRSPHSIQKKTLMSAVRV